MTVFVFVMVDRIFALWVVSVKARRILNRRRGKGDTRNLQHRAIEVIERDYGFIQAVILLLSYLFLGLLLIVQRAFILNEIGKVGFAFFGFLVSMSVSMLNGFIENLDAKP